MNKTPLLLVNGRLNKTRDRFQCKQLLHSLETHWVIVDALCCDDQRSHHCTLDPLTNTVNDHSQQNQMFTNSENYPMKQMRQRENRSLSSLTCSMTTLCHCKHPKCWEVISGMTRGSCLPMTKPVSVSSTSLSTSQQQILVDSCCSQIRSKGGSIASISHADMFAVNHPTLDDSIALTSPATLHNYNRTFISSLYLYSVPLSHYDSKSKSLFKCPKLLYSCVTHNIG